ncbi:MAG: transglutaminase domain-containing protein [Thermoplasmatales archaeon]|nr:transglutaminase domain-containing protein [Thermoplasmatales archaeon]
MKKIISVFMIILMTISGFGTIPSSAHDLPSEDFSDYIQPVDNAVQQIVRNNCKHPLEENLMDNIKILYGWVCDNIDYKSDNDIWRTRDYYQLPSTTISKRSGDCEDQAILLVSLLRVAGISNDSIQVVIGFVSEIIGTKKNMGHAWVEIKESTDIQSNLVATPSSIGIEEWKGKEVVIHTNDGNIYSNFTTENLDLVQTAGYGERNGWIPLDTTMTDALTGWHVPFEFWMWFGYGNYLLFNLKIDMKSLKFYFDEETEASVYTSNGTFFNQYYPLRGEIIFGIENNGEETIYVSECCVKKKVGVKWETVYTQPDDSYFISGEGELKIDDRTVVPGDKREWSWNQTQSNGEDAESGEYCVVINYNVWNNWESSTGYALFSICPDYLIPLPTSPEALYIYTDKEIYAPDENVSITVQNIGVDSLFLIKWYVEKKSLSGIWEIVYESSIFSNYVLFPVNDTFVVAIPYNDTTLTVPSDGTVIGLPNATISIWGNDTAIIGNWTTIAPLLGNQSSGISITDSISNSNITGWIIEMPLINWSGGSSGWINYTTVTNGDAGLDTQISIGPDVDLTVVNFDIFSTDVTGTNDNSFTGKSLTFIEGGNWFYGASIDDLYGTPLTMLLPNQKLTWIWSQITSDGGESGLGEYRVNIEYDNSYVNSESFNIAFYLQLKETSVLGVESHLDDGRYIVCNLSENSLVGDGLSFPDSPYIYDGFLIDLENDGTYDVFQSIVTEKQTDVKQDDSENYLIDTDGDGHWDYTYDPVAGTTNSFIEKKESETSGKISWTILGIVSAVLVLLVVIVYFYKKQRL